ncbi:MAG: sn-glycerol-3-phosphate ABC transporter ATP-binding protein UgpC [SAR324 cluster bacterium]|nr:sn-glycerol-3-phosphate ABC transporter ATP-binding protein UgpC [SAR324 cluster bacterium]
MGALTIKNVCKSYGPTDVLKGVNIDIQAGEFLILVGPSGCGKSTLLNMIAGLDGITSGEIQIDGRVVNNLPPKDRDIAMVFQSYALYPNMDIRRNISFGLEIRKVPKSEQDRIVNEVSSMLQIDQLLDRKPSQLSGGQRQRVAMGRALARKPALYLFDEPLSNLDAKLRVDMRTEIKMLHQRLKTTIVYVTHDQIEAMTLADKIAVMKGGIVQQFGSPRQLYDEPANMFVAGFMGSPSMNFIPCKVVSMGNETGVEIDGGAGTFKLPVRSNQLKSSEGQEVMLGIRPEKVTHKIESHLENSDFHLAKCRVSINEPTGPDTNIFIHMNGAKVVCRSTPDSAKDPGEEMEMMFDLSKMVFFDPKTEERLA